MMTLSVGENWFLNMPPTRVRSSLRDLRGRLGAGGTEPPEPPPFGRREKRSAMVRRLGWFGPRPLELTLGSVELLQPFSERAARPQAMLEEKADALVLTLLAPGARPENTDIVWDEEQRRLVVGVWAGKRRGLQRRRRPSELVWYRSHWLPRHAGRAARATVNRGRIEVTVPTALGSEVSGASVPDARRSSA
jgi:HSP20 family molecular chaperone IbpA